ncbi:MAG: hypothetical protein ACRC2H_00995 [Silanimonas sp.]
MTIRTKPRKLKLSAHRTLEYFTPADVDALLAAERAKADDSDLDGTDGAHPAWWRGSDHGFVGAVAAIQSILDGSDNGSGVANEPWESARRKLIALRDRAIAVPVVDAIPVGASMVFNPRGPRGELR